MSQSSSRSDWFTEKDLHVGGNCTRVSFHAIFILHIIVITALHVMQTRYSDENSVRLSVCLSVRPSVCPSVTCVYCDKTVERSVQIYIPYERTFSLVF